MKLLKKTQIFRFRADCKTIFWDSDINDHWTVNKDVENGTLTL